MASVAHGHGGAAARARVLVLGGGAAREPDDLVLARRPARPAASGRTAAVPRPGHGAAFGFASILLSCGARRRGRDTRRGWRNVRGPSHLLCPAPCAWVATAEAHGQGRLTDTLSSFLRLASTGLLSASPILTGSRFATSEARGLSWAALLASRGPLPQQ